VIKRKAAKVTLEEIARCTGITIPLLYIERKKPCEVALNAELHILGEED
jgi:hypothetical protein